jgi:hypothetical protein
MAKVSKDLKVVSKVSKVLNVAANVARKISKYMVVVNDCGKSTCTCLDHYYRNHDCKHILLAKKQPVAPTVRKVRKVPSDVAWRGFVKSRTVPGTRYEVVFKKDGGARSCTCPDHIYRNKDCKHIKGVLGTEKNYLSKK